MEEASKTTEAKVLEIAGLNAVFASEVLTQAKEIEHIHDTAVDSVEAIGRGNKELRKAAEQGASFRILMLVFLVLSSFSLLLLHHLNN